MLAGVGLMQAKTVTGYFSFNASQQGSDRFKQNPIPVAITIDESTASADAVAFTPELTSGIKIGTLISNLLPIAVILEVIWVIFFIIWYLIGLPIGPGVGSALPVGIL